MKTRMQIIMSAVFVSLFVGGIASAQSHETEGVAEMSPFHTSMKTCNTSGEAVIGLQCAGGYCAAINGTCDQPNVSVTNNCYDAGPYSEEDGQFFCNYNYVVTGFKVDGYNDYGDDITMRCCRVNNTVNQDPNVTPGYDGTFCQWTDWISEELINDSLDPNGGNWSTFGGVLDNYVECPTDIPPASGYTGVVHGMECNGPYCDNMRLYCCSYH